MTTRGPGPPRTGAGVEEEEDGAAAGAADRRRGAGEEAWERGRPIECVTFVRELKACAVLMHTFTGHMLVGLCGRGRGVGQTRAGAGRRAKSRG